MNDEFCRKISGSMILHSFGPELDEFDILELELSETFCRDILEVMQIEEIRNRIGEVFSDDQGPAIPIHQALWNESQSEDCYLLDVVFHVTESDIDVSYKIRERGLYPDDYGNWDIEQWYEE